MDKEYVENLLKFNMSQEIKQAEKRIKELKEYFAKENNQINKGDN